MPPCPSRIHVNEFLAPLKFISAPPVTLSWRRVCLKQQLVNELDPNFNQFEAVFLSKLGDLLKKRVFTEIQTVFSAEIKWSQKKRFSPTMNELQNKKLHYSGPNNGKFFTTSAPQSRWGAVLFIYSFICVKRKSAHLKRKKKTRTHTHKKRFTVMH